jgi:hypothetical protein
MENVSVRAIISPFQYPIARLCSSHQPKSYLDQNDNSYLGSVIGSKGCAFVFITYTHNRGGRRTKNLGQMTNYHISLKFTPFKNMDGAIDVTTPSTLDEPISETIMRDCT